MRDDRPPEELTKAELLARMARNARKIVRECDQAIIDGEYWMRLHPTWKPVDLEWFKVHAAKARSVLKQLGESE